MPNYVVKEKFPKFKDFNLILESVGWKVRTSKVLRQNRRKSIFCVSVYDDYSLVGAGRVFGDGIYYYLCDILVKKTYQGKTIGKIVVENLLSQIDYKIKDKNIHIYLYSTKGKEEFYEKFGFRRLPTDRTGSGMVLYR